MIFSQPLEVVVKHRYSVRTYSKVPVEKDVLASINAYLPTLSNLFGAHVIIRMIEKELKEDGTRLGTYGMIKGASIFLGAAVPNTTSGLYSVGYEFEQLILFLTTQKLGTCWLGGTFNRGGFKKAMAVPDDMIIPVISPVGYIEKKRLTETLVRKFAKSDSRKPCESLFFENDFSVPLRHEIADSDLFPLEMVRLGPSASNKQPWRIVRCGNRYHFYKKKTPGYSGVFDFDIQDIDMGIAACHFDLAVQEQGRVGRFDLSADPKLELQDNMFYSFSWIGE